MPDAPRRSDAEPPGRLGDRCVAYLKGLLLDGGLNPGDTVSIEAVARAVGVSRQPAMEAVKRLAAEGFIAIQPQVGCHVVRPESDHVEDFFRLFSASEGLLAKMAAERRSDEECHAFEDLLTEIGKALSQRDSATLSGASPRLLNRRYLEFIHSMARSPVVTDISAGMWDRCDFYVRVAFGPLIMTRWLRRAHAALKDSILAGDGHRAEREMIAFLWTGGQSVTRRLRRLEAKARVAGED